MPQSRGHHVQMVDLFGLYLFLHKRCCENPQSAMDLTQCKPARAIIGKCWRNHNLTIFQLQLFASTSPVLTRQHTFEKKLAREIFSEEIIEFELRGPRPCSCTCTLTTDYFHDKTKMLKENL